DILANHPATAAHICRKLCTRFVSDKPSENLINAVSKVWLEHRDSKDQIGQTILAIVLSEEFSLSFGSKLKNPLEFLLSFVRASGVDFMPDYSVVHSLQHAGYRIFEYPVPTGHPDVSEYWTSSNMILCRWNMILNLVAGWLHKGVPGIRATTPPNLSTAKEIVDYWMTRILPHPLPTDDFWSLVGFMTQGFPVDAVPESSNPRDLDDRFNNLAALISMAPSFQLR
ncbi:MAG: DUF1800 domain-containing protein, partial [Cyanobacteria bacterium]|nr:DUF1800 domain-containing protein [Cyanobacteriota bacterium]